MITLISLLWLLTTTTAAIIYYIRGDRNLFISCFLAIFGSPFAVVVIAVVAVSWVVLGVRAALRLINKTNQYDMHN